MVFDLVIVGAGPASCACAIQALDSGLSVLMVEREKFPRHRPGETLHPGIEPLLIQLGLESNEIADKSLRFSGITRISLNGNKTTFRFGGKDEDWQGFQIKREILDQELLKQVLNRGGQVLLDTKLHDIKREQRLWELDTSNGVYCGEFLIDGSGAQCASKATIGCKTKYHSPKFYLTYGYISGHSSSDEVVFREQNNGWFYRAKLCDELTHWCVLTTTPIKSGYVPYEFKGYKAADVNRRQNATWQTNEPFSGARYYLIGDAAYRLDPSSSHGVLKAIMSGMFAAHIICNTKNGRLSDSVSQAIYHKFIMKLFEQETEQLKQTGWYRNIVLKS